MLFNFYTHTIEKAYVERNKIGNFCLINIEDEIIIKKKYCFFDVSIDNSVNSGVLIFLKKYKMIKDFINEIIKIIYESLKTSEI